MTLMTRMIRLFKADAHGLLDLLEDPQAVLRQAVRDMEAEIENGEQVLTGLTRQEERLQGLRTTLEEHLREYERQIDLCFEEGNHDLARRFIRKRLEAQKRLKSVLHRLHDTAARKEAHVRNLRAQKEQLESIVEKMHIVVEHPPHRGVQDPTSPCESWEMAVSEEDVEIAFLDEQRKRSRPRTDTNAN
jgi:phage shock protein A